jgi:hypothetical protein
MNEQPNNQPENKKEQVIWEEKNYIELPKNSEPQELLDKKDITPGTKNESMPKLCENISKEEKLRQYQREYQREYRKNNPEKVRERDRLNRLKNIEAERKRERNYYHKNKEVLKARNNNYYKMHKEERNKKIADYRKKNPDKNKEYYREHKEEINRKKKEKRQTPIQKEKDKIYSAEYHQKNKEKCRTTSLKYYHDHAEDRKQKSRTYKKNNRPKINARCGQRYHSDINYKIGTLLRSRLKSAIQNNQKTGSAVRDMGCSIDDFKLHYQSTFTPQMTWKHFMDGLIHIDHIIPLSSFDLSNREELLKACHYTNLQPLWATTAIARANGDMISIGNLEKGDKITPSL